MKIRIFLISLLLFLCSSRVFAQRSYINLIDANSLNYYASGIKWPSGTTLTEGTGRQYTIGFTSLPVDTNLTVPTIYGSTAANGDLTLEGTSSATKTTSYVILQPTGGNVGIGTTTPVCPLQIKRINGTAFDITDGVATDPKHMSAMVYTTGGLGSGYGALQAIYENYVYLPIALNPNGGNVGIGTTAPASILETSKLGTVKTVITLFETTNTGNAADMDGTEGQWLGNLFYYDVTTPAKVDTVAIRYGAEQDFTSTASTQDGYLAFWTSLDGTLAEKVRVTSGGNVGIGTTAPGAPLHISGGVSGANEFIVERTGAYSGKYAIYLPLGQFAIKDITTGVDLLGLLYNNPGAGNMNQILAGRDQGVNSSVGISGMLRATNAGTSGTDTAGGNLYLASGKGQGNGVQSNIYIQTPDKVGTGTTQQTYSTKLTILGSGNVGIGTTSPEGLLEVQGVAHTDAKFYLDANGGVNANDTWILNSEASSNLFKLINDTDDLFTIGQDALGDCVTRISAPGDNSSLYFQPTLGTDPNNNWYIRATTGRIFGITSLGDSRGDFGFSNCNVSISGTLTVDDLTTAGGTNDVYSIGGVLTTVVSSRRFKQDISPIDNMLNALLQLVPVQFTWNENTASEGKQDVGLIAEDVAEVLPNVPGLIIYEADGTTVRGMNYSRLSILLLQGMKEQQEIINNQQEQIQEIKSRLDKIETVLNKGESN